MSTEQQPSDAELISAVRGGDTTAYGELFSRHVEAARRLARQLTSAGDVEDLVSEAFAKVLTIVQRGGGPDLAFRAYLLTAVRSLHIDSVRGAARLRPVDDFAPFDDGVPFRDTAVEGFENKAAARAFATLPERWQLVLWHTEVEGQKPAEVAKLLGMSANSVSALAYRAREGLRQAFLNMHAQDAEDDACAWTQDNLGAYIRSAASKRDSAKVRAHIDECRRCMGIYLELSEVNTNLSGILGPMVLGTAAAGYIAAAVGTAHRGLVGMVSTHASSAALVAVAAAVVVITGLVFALRGPSTEAPPVADPQIITAPPAPSTQLDLVRNGPIDRLPSPSEPADPPETDTGSPAAPTTSASVPDASTPSGNPSTPDEEPDGTLVPPTTNPPPPPPNDVTVRAVKTVKDQDVTDLRVTMTGLADGGGTLFINGTKGVADPSLSVGMDGRCTSVSADDWSCAIEASAKPVTLNIQVTSSPGAPDAMFAFVMTPDAGVEDADTGNNDDSVTVDPAERAAGETLPVG